MIPELSTSYTALVRLSLAELRNNSSVFTKLLNL